MPETIEVKYVLIEFTENPSEPRGESEVDYLLDHDWTISAQVPTGPRTMIVTLWRTRRDY